MQKIAVFVDVQELMAQGEVALATAYAIQRSDDQQHKFQKALKHIGFDVKLKPFIQRSDGSAKGDWDVGIAIDVIAAAEGNVDTIVLLSGDGDFDLLLNHVKAKYGVKTIVYGVPNLTANSLINVADEYHKIEQSLLL